MTTGIGTRRRGCVARGVRGVLGAVALSIAVLAAGAASAVPIRVPGTDSFSYTTETSNVPGRSGGFANVLGIEGAWVGNEYKGGGGIYANAWASAYALGSASVYTATLIWGLDFEAPDRALDLYLDWDLTLFSAASALLGDAGGGAQLKVAVWQQGFMGIPSLVGYGDWVFNDTITTGNVSHIGRIDAGEEWWMVMNFIVGSAASVWPLIGLAAEADNIGMLDFTLWADDGRPPVPAPEPAALWLFAGGLSFLALIRRGRAAERRIAFVRA